MKSLSLPLGLSLGLLAGASRAEGPASTSTDPTLDVSPVAPPPVSNDPEKVVHDAGALHPARRVHRGGLTAPCRSERCRATPMI